MSYGFILTNNCFRWQWNWWKIDKIPWRCCRPAIL